MVADPSGRVVASTDALLTDEIVSWPELRAAPGQSSSATVELRGTSNLIAAAPILTYPTAAGEPISQLGIALIAQPSPSRLDSLITAGPSLLTTSGQATVVAHRHPVQHQYPTRADYHRVLFDPTHAGEHVA